MKVLLDTNIILDALMERTPFDVEAKEILLRSQNGALECMFTAHAATDIFYLYNKARTMQAAKAAWHFLLAQYGVVAVTRDNRLTALSLPIDDFEDAWVVACAQKAEVDCIVTRDDAFLRDRSPVPIQMPGDVLGALRG